MERKDHVNFWYVILAMTTVLLLQSYWMSAQHTETIPYSKFEELLKAGAVKDIAIGRDTITGTLKEPAKDQKPHFSVVRIDPGFAETLERYGVEFTPQDMRDLKPLPSGILGLVTLIVSKPD